MKKIKNTYINRLGFSLKQRIGKSVFHLHLLRSAMVWPSYLSSPPLMPCTPVLQPYQLPCRFPNTCLCQQGLFTGFSPFLPLMSNSYYPSNLSSDIPYPGSLPKSYTLDQEPVLLSPSTSPLPFNVFGRDVVSH